MNNTRNEIKAHIVRAGFTMQEVLEQRESIRYREVIELADVLGYDIVWQKRRER